MNPETLQERNQLRKSMRQKRRALSYQEQRTASKRLCNQLKRSSHFMRAKKVAVYLASDGEIDPVEVIRLCWKLNKRVYLPVLHPVRYHRLWFTEYTRTTRLNLNRYKIKEPAIKRPGTAPWALNLVLMPLVAFDENGGRMGMGGGYYDRTFEFKLQRAGYKGPALVGLAHDFQRVNRLPLADWDVPLTGVVSDKRRYLI